MEELKFRNLMTKGVKCAGPQTPLSESVRSMKENLYSCIVITDQQSLLNRD